MSVLKKLKWRTCANLVIKYVYYSSVSQHFDLHYAWVRRRAFDLEASTTAIRSVTVYPAIVSEEQGEEGG